MLAIIVIGAMLLFKVIFGLAISWNVFIIPDGIAAAIFVISFIVAVVNMMKDFKTILNFIRNYTCSSLFF
ncbi:MAG: hypothetical protein J6J11_03235 [Treponema sp.]|nr:hypothetical protein [Treponema sp.]